MIRSPSILAVRRAACAVALLAASPCFASLQSAKDAPLALKFTMSCRVNADLSKDCTNVWHYDILTAAGRDSLSQVHHTAPYNQSISDVEAYVIKRDGTRTRLPDSQIVEKSGTGPDQGIDNSTTKVMLFQGLEVGGAVEYRSKDHTETARGTSAFHQAISLDPEAVRYDSFHVDYTANQPIIWRGEELDDFEVKSTDGGKKIDIDLAKPRYFFTVNEDDFTVRKVPRIELAFSDKLADHYGMLAGIYSKMLSAPLPPQAAREVERLKGKPRVAQIQALVKFLGDHYRYLADYRLGGRGLIPLDFAQVEENGYGDCKDLTMLLAAMIRGLGMEAEPAFVVRGDYAPPLLIPTLSAPNHAIVRAIVDGKTWWIDATNPVLLPGYTPADLQDRWAIVVGKNGMPRLDTIPLEEAALAQDSSQDTRVHRDGTSDVNSSVLFNGAKLLSLMQHEHDEGAHAVDQVFCEDNKNCSVTRQPVDQMKPPYVVKIHWPDQPPPTRHEGKYLGSLSDPFALDLDGLKNYRRTGGTGDLNIGTPMIRQMSIKIGGIKFSQPTKACHVRSRWFDYDAEGRQDANGAMAYKLRSVNKVAWISHAELMSDEFGKFLGQAEECFEGLTYSYTIDPATAQPGK